FLRRDGLSQTRSPFGRSRRKGPSQPFQLTQTMIPNPKSEVNPKSVLLLRFPRWESPCAGRPDFVSCADPRSEEERVMRMWRGRPRPREVPCGSESSVRTFPKQKPCRDGGPRPSGRAKLDICSERKL